MVPSPTELTYFQEIANTNNFTKAANKLGVSQPSLSIAVKRLEKYIGAELFIRHKSGATLTPAGKKLFLQTKLLMNNWDTIRLDAFAAHQQIQGQTTLGCPTAVALHLREFLPELLELYPHLTFNLKHDISSNLTMGVIEGVIDIGLVSNPVKHPDLIIKKIRDADFGFWRSTKVSTTQDIHSKKLVIICDPNLPQTGILLNKCKHKELNSARLITSNNLEIVASLTAAGCGIGILPSCYSQSTYANILQPVPSTPNCSDALYLIYRKESRNVKAVVAVIDAIKQYVEKIL